MRWSLFFLILLFFQSCSYREMILKKAPDFLSDQVNDHLKLNDVQEAKLRLKVTNAFFSHRDEVVVIRDLLKSYRIKEDSLAAYIKKGYTSYATIQITVNNISISVLSELDYSQRQDILKRYREETPVSGDKKISYEERGVSRLENFFGKLSLKQIELIKDYAKIYAKSVQADNRWSKNYERTLSLKDQKKYKAQLKKYFSGVISLKTILESNKEFFTFFDQFKATLNADQVKRFDDKRKEILNWIDLYLKIYQLPIIDT